MEQHATGRQQTRVQKIPARDLARHAQGFVVAAICASRPGTVHFFPPHVSVLPPALRAVPGEPSAALCIIGRMNSTPPGNLARLCYHLLFSFPICRGKNGIPFPGTGCGIRGSVMKDTLGVLLAGGAGERLYPLTRDRAKP